MNTRGENLEFWSKDLSSFAGNSFSLEYAVCCIPSVETVHLTMNHQVSCVKKLPKCLWFIPVSMPYALKHVPILSWDVPYDQMTGVVKARV